MTRLEVLMPTYRHAAYVEQAIESVLAQRTTDVEVVLLISDDGSDDGTPDIIRRYAQRYPERIRTRFVDPATKRHDSTDPLPGRATLIAHYRWATAEYVGLLEGDDYWIDEHKVQLQVDHLRAHPEQSFCFTNAYNEYDGARRVDYVRSWLKGRTPEAVLGQRDIVAANFIPTAGVVYRRACFPEIPEAFHTVAALDWILYIALTEHGDIGFLDRFSAVRRVHEGGVISMKPLLEKIERNFHLLDRIDVMTHERWSDLLNDRRVDLARMALKEASAKGDVTAGIAYLERINSTPAWRSRMSAKELLYHTLSFRYPGLHRLTNRVLGSWYTAP